MSPYIVWSDNILIFPLLIFGGFYNTVTVTIPVASIGCEVRIVIRLAAH